MCVSATQQPQIVWHQVAAFNIRLTGRQFANIQQFLIASASCKIHVAAFDAINFFAPVMFGLPA